MHTLRRLAFLALASLVFAACGFASPDELQTVSGTVVDQHGRPIVGATVTLGAGLGEAGPRALERSPGDTWERAPLGAAATDGSGRFAILVSPATTAAIGDLQVQVNGCIDVHPASAALAARTDVDLGEIVFPLGPELEGTVVADTAPTMAVAGALVAGGPGHMLFSRTAPFRRFDTRVDDAGRFRLDLGRSGEIVLRVSADGFVTTTVDVSPDGDDHPVRVRLSPGGRTLAGEVVGARGEPVGGASVWAWPGRATTTPDGRFTITGLPAPAQSVHVTAAGRGARLVEEIEASTPIRVMMSAPGEVVMPILDRAGAPARVATVWVRTVSDTAPCGHYALVPPTRLRARDRGVARVSGVAPGVWVLEVHAPEHALAFSAPFIVEADRTTSLPPLRLDQGGALCGVVLRPDGSPMVGARVETQPIDVDENSLVERFQDNVPCTITRAATETSRDGSYHLSCLTPGQYFVRVLHPEFCRERVGGLVVVRGSVVVVPPFRLQRGTLVHGMVSGRERPDQKIRVFVCPPDYAKTGKAPTEGAVAWALGHTDEHGRFRLARRLPPGRYTVELSLDYAYVLHHGAETARQPEIVLSDSRAEQELSLRFEIVFGGR